MTEWALVVRQLAMRHMKSVLTLLLGMASAGGVCHPVDGGMTVRKLELDKARECLKAIKTQQVPGHVERALEIAAEVFNRDDNSTGTLLREGLIRNPKAKARRGVAYELGQTLDGKPLKLSELWGLGDRLQGVRLEVENEFSVSWSGGDLGGLEIYLPGGKMFMAIWEPNKKIWLENVVDLPKQCTYEQMGGFTWMPLPERLTAGESDKDGNASFFADCLAKIKDLQRSVESLKTKMSYTHANGEYIGEIKMETGGTLFIRVGGPSKTVLNMIEYETDPGHPGRFEVSWGPDELYISQDTKLGKPVFMIRCDSGGKVMVFADNRGK